MAQAAIRFKKINRYRRAIGSIDTQMGYGVQHELVQRGIAEWVDTAPAASTAGDIEQAQKPRRTRTTSDKECDR